MKIAALGKRPTRRIIGIDPGTNLLGFAVLEETRGKRSLSELGVHRVPRGISDAEKLRSIFDFVGEVMLRFDPDECAVEAPFYGKNVQSMLKLGRAQGVVMAAAIAHGVPVSEYAPKKVKMSVTGSGGASKEQVADMLCSMLNFKRGNMPLDATDAAAVGLCHLNQGPLGSVRRETYNGWKAFVEQHPERSR